jgi:glycosyltransferase involved in cell wall biosynthesis
VKVLIGAYACEPSQGSEPAVGWHWAHEAVRAGHDVWVVTRRNNRPAIESALATADAPAPNFEYLDLPGPFLWAKRRFGHLGLLAYCYLWQVALIAVARRLHRRVGFDIAHHVTFVNDTLPSGLCVLAIPFVWGPVGGSTHRIPDSIVLDLPPYARRHERVRTALQFLLGRVDPFVALTRRRAKLILVYTREALEGLSRNEQRRARAIVHIGVSEDAPPHRSAPPQETGQLRLRVLTGGRLVHWKGQDLLIEGFARFVRTAPEADALLTITGSGRYEPALEALAAREGVRDRIEFVGLLPKRDDVFALMGDSDLFALPTLRDGPPVALLEAMAYGLPVLCLDLGATAELVPDQAGIKVPPDSRESVVARIAEACAWVAKHPAKAAAMGQAARRHALEHHNWRRIRDEIERAYADVSAVPGRPGQRPRHRRGVRR